MKEETKLPNKEECKHEEVAMNDEKTESICLKCGSRFRKGGEICSPSNKTWYEFDVGGKIWLRICEAFYEGDGKKAHDAISSLLTSATIKAKEGIYRELTMKVIYGIERQSRLNQDTSDQNVALYSARAAILTDFHEYAKQIGINLE